MTGGGDISAKLPVTIIGGYLGSGKTTLVNHLLRHADGVRLAVLVNEFGALPIDSDLIESQDENVISIAGGCVCCSYGNDLIVSMVDLAKMQPRPEHILIESSGVALPGAIAATVDLLADYRFDGIVTLVDAETGKDRAADKYVGETVRQQLHDADIIVLNKTDLVSGDELDAVANWLAETVPDARQIRVTQAAVPLEVVLESHLGRDRVRRPAIANHDHFYETMRLDCTGPVDVDALGKTLAAAGLLRAKGFVRSHDGELHTLQIVGRRWRRTPAPAGAVVGMVCIAIKDQYDRNAIVHLTADDEHTARHRASEHHTAKAGRS